MENKSAFLVFTIVGVMITVSVFVSHNADTFSKIQKRAFQNDVPLSQPKEGVAEITVPAVDAEGEGTLGKFRVEVTPGDGKTLTNIDNLFYFVDTQFSIQTAKSVAENVTGTDLSKYNIVYGIRTGDGDSGVVEGPSAGAALTIATIAAIENKTLDPKVAITGTINQDGTVGKVGGVESKLEAVEDIGVEVFLVPEGQGFKPDYRVETACENIDGFNFCKTEYVEDRTPYTSDSGVVVIEVADVSEALKYFLQ